MKREEEILNKYGRQSGMEVPEDYFKGLESRIMSSLPEYPEKPKKVELTAWQRVRPYLYLAAMFCGIWLMMKVFHQTQSDSMISLDNVPAGVITMAEVETSPYYEPGDEVDDYIVEEEVSDNYVSIDDFERDFGYELTADLKQLDLSEIRNQNGV